MADYRIEWQEGHGLRTDPEPLMFSARTDILACKRVARELEVSEPLTPRKLYAAGAEGVYRGKTKIFPTPSRRRRKSRR